MSDLLLDVNIVVDICTPREEFALTSAAAVAKCLQTGNRVWLYAGSVQTYEYVLQKAIADKYSQQNIELSRKRCAQLAREALQSFAEDKQWLAALAGEGDVFASEDPEDEQLIRALRRFPEGGIYLLTRDVVLQKRCPQALTAEQYLALSAMPASVDFVDLRKQQAYTRSELEQNIHKVLHHGQYILGPEVRELEARLADYVGVKHCIGVASGTDALLIALMALGVGAGDEVITTPFSFIATAETIVLLGAKPVFVDIDPLTYNIDPGLIEAAITPKTRAIMPVSLYGQCADFDAINAIAEKHSLPVIEDGAQSFGATYKGRQSCGLSTIGCTSFFPSKPLGGYGDGGACFTDDDELAIVLRRISTHGQERRYYHTHIGVNGRLDTLQAAVLLAKFDVFPDEVAARERIGALYTELLEAVDGIRTPYVEAHNTCVYAQYTVQTENRAMVQARLKETDIPTAVHYPSGLHRQPALKDDRAGLSQCDAAAERVLSLPMHPYLTLAEQQKICAALRLAVA